MSQVPAGWHHDPYGRFQQRYWDGTRWTEHVATNGQQTIDPMGSSPVVPFAIPPSASTTPAVDPTPTTPAADTDNAAPRRVLDTLGDGAVERPRPSLRASVAGLGGAVLAVGVLVAAVGDDGSRGTTIAVSLLLLAVAWAARQFVHVPEVAAAAVGAAVVAILVFGVAATTSDGNGGFLTGLTIAVLFLAAWLLPGFRGRGLMLGLGVLALITAFGSLTSDDNALLDKCNAYIEAGDFESFDAECQDLAFEDGNAGFVPAEITDNLGDQGLVYLIGAAACLGTTWWLDRRGYRGTATALAAAGLVSALVGTALFAQEFGDTGGPVVVGIVGAVLCVVGSHGARRATTWWGAALLAVGVVAFLAVQIEPDSATGFGSVAVLGGALLIGLPMLAAPMRRAVEARGTPEAPAAD